MVRYTPLNPPPLPTHASIRETLTCLTRFSSKKKEEKVSLPQLFLFIFLVTTSSLSSRLPGSRLGLVVLFYGNGNCLSTRQNMKSASFLLCSVMSLCDVCSLPDALLLLFSWLFCFLFCAFCSFLYILCSFLFHASFFSMLIIYTVGDFFFVYICLFFFRCILMFSPLQYIIVLFFITYLCKG